MSPFLDVNSIYLLALNRNSMSEKTLCTFQQNDMYIHYTCLFLSLNDLHFTSQTHIFLSITVSRISAQTIQRLIDDVFTGFQFLSIHIDDI